MSKYKNLNIYLESIPSEVLDETLTFIKIEKIINTNLPPSAYKYREWWANPSSLKQHPHAQSWLAAGWKVMDVNQVDNWVRFKRGDKLKAKKHKILTKSENSLNPSKGKQFQITSGQLLSERFSVDIRLEYPIMIGNPAKKHKFDIVSSDLYYVGECKNYSWTKSGNVPSAKMGFTNEAVFYLTFLPKEKYRFVIMSKNIHPNRNESLAEYYYRTNKHLLQGVHILELDLESNTILEIK